jgi:aminoglycoside phosphotransferase (APT) family kinase protein
MTTGGAADSENDFWPLLAAGATADIFLLDDDRVLRRYRDGRDTTTEVALMRHVAEHGYPVPALYSFENSDLVMEHLYGPTLLQALAAGEFSLQDGADIMADLHARLHAVPAPEGAADGDVVIHLGLHPGNIVLSENYGPALLDWTNATVGSRDLDVAMTAIVLGEVAVDSSGAYSRAARAMLVAFLAVVDGNPLTQLDVAAAARLADPALAHDEKKLVGPAAALVRQYSRDVIIGGEPDA